MTIIKLIKKNKYLTCFLFVSTSVVIAVVLVEGIGDHGSVLGEVVTVTGDEGGARHESIVAAEIKL